MTGAHWAYLRNAAALRERLRRAGVTDTQAARRADITPATVSELLTGRRSCCSVDDAQAIADVLSCRFEDLFATL